MCGRSLRFAAFGALLDVASITPACTCQTLLTTLYTDYRAELNPTNLYNMRVECLFKV